MSPLWVYGFGVALSVAPGDDAPKDGAVARSVAAKPAVDESRVCVPPKPLDVLFIGNSYLIMHHVEELVATLGEQAGVELRTELLAMGGKNFEYHLHRDKTAAKLAARDWDYVIMASHSLDTIRNREGFLDAGEGLVDLVREAGAEPLLFETWARRADSGGYRYGRNGHSPAEMHAMVHRGYAELSRRTGAEVIDVGAAWLAFKRRAPSYNLHASDANHPGKLGSYLTANVVLATLTDLSPVGNVGPLLGVDRTAARLARRQAAETVQPSCDRF